MKLITVALAGLVALVAASPVETTAAAVASKYENDDVHTYKCDSDKYVLSCLRSGTCSFVEACSFACADNSKGAWCTGASEKRDVDFDVHIEDKKTYECAKDRTGVLVCQYGFCQTDHYCKKGWKCRDNCNCCKKPSMFDRDVDDAEIAEASPRSKDPSVSSSHAPTVVESDTLAKRDPPCAPGTYTCLDSATTGAWIMTCDYKGAWQYSSNCGTLKCLERSDGAAHCWNPGPEWNTDLAAAKREAPCMPGTYSCDNDESTDDAWIMTCDYRGKWVQSANCGDLKCLALSNGAAHCWNPGPEWNTAIAARDEPSEVPSDVAPSQSCEPGTFGCTFNSGTGTSWVITCSPSGIWQNAKPTIGARDELLQVPSELAPSMSCSPGAFNCAYRNATQTEWTVTCEQSGSYWQWSADCGKGWKCVSDGRVAHCVPKQALFEAWEAWEATQTSTSTLEVEASAKA
ncbi:hypothetical protein J4E90_009824 [Alternaria incomplexa]|uniref:uncharacterized protein n=1 Tax=Alternaria incomplexa TaxID=1187928 RepID=UPI002220BC0F|nr:uncharacterized protein J4E90_009824 [Alternaria incomplexa]KAI4907321.1 hypothetical protein J4E90_009824 [Alternaria incomplexa]